MAASGSRATDTPSFSASEVEFIRNKYTRKRGEPTLLKLSCAECASLICFYQKDGKGRLLRCYRDRIHYPSTAAEGSQLACMGCSKVIGTPMIYEPEKRAAFRLRPGTFSIERIKK